MNEIIILALTTSLGNFEIELYPEQAPVTSANFLEYAEEGFFENVLFLSSLAIERLKKLRVKI